MVLERVLIDERNVKKTNEIRENHVGSNYIPHGMSVMLFRVMRQRTNSP